MKVHVKEVSSFAKHHNMSLIWMCDGLQLPTSSWAVLVRTFPLPLPTCLVQTLLKLKGLRKPFFSPFQHQLNQPSFSRLQFFILKKKITFSKMCPSILATSRYQMQANSSLLKKWVPSGINMTISLSLRKQYQQQNLMLVSLI